MLAPLEFLILGTRICIYKKFLSDSVAQGTLKSRISSQRRAFGSMCSCLLWVTWSRLGLSIELFAIGNQFQLNLSSGSKILAALTFLTLCFPAAYPQTHALADHIYKACPPFTSYQLATVTIVPYYWESRKIRQAGSEVRGLLVEETLAVYISQVP